MQKYYYIYILTNKRNGTLYVGITANLKKRIWYHKTKMNKKSFTAKYSINKLVYYEQFLNVEFAIHREKLIKTWNRSWKLTLIESKNPEWRDLFYEICF